MVDWGYTMMTEQSGSRALVDDVAGEIPCGTDVEEFVEKVKLFADAGFSHVALVQIGGESQLPFVEWAQRDLLPKLREL